MDEATIAKKQKGRSPRYPGIDLETAVERARQLWEKEAHYATNVQTILKHWGYAPKSGGGAVALAALIAFGLLEDEGSGDARKAHLTTLAESILLSDDPMVRRGAIQEAALLPPAHADLWDRYGPQLASDQSLDHYLRHERGFTPSGASEFLSEYKRTIQFANLTDRGGTVSRDVPGIATRTKPEPPVSEPAVAERTGGAPPRQTHIQIPVPLSEGMATLSLPRYISAGSWAQLETVLSAYKALTMAPRDETEAS